jgi:formimidoylglutamate deiminase
MTAGARVVLCPLTEAYLGDGLFAADDWVAAGGGFAVGSDSNCRIDAVEELRCLEFGQRLGSGQRARLADSQGLGMPLWSGAARGGAAALAQPVGALEVGCRADIVVLDADAAPWAGQPAAQIPDALIIGGSRHDIAAIYAAGERLVESGVIRDAAAIRSAFADVVRRLAAKED